MKGRFVDHRIIIKIMSNRKCKYLFSTTETFILYNFQIECFAVVSGVVKPDVKQHLPNLSLGF